VRFCVLEAVPDAGAVTLSEWRAVMTCCGVLGSNIGANVGAPPFLRQWLAKPRRCLFYVLVAARAAWCRVGLCRADGQAEGLSLWRSTSPEGALAVAGAMRSIWQYPPLLPGRTGDGWRAAVVSWNAALLAA
jgi:hypothetical protein